MEADVGIEIRRAEAGDEGALLDLIGQLADYERLRHQVVASEAGLAEWLFGGRAFVESQVAWEGPLAVGCAIYYPSFSTFRGAAGLYLEDLFVRLTHRRRGIGLALLQAYARRAQERRMAFLEWRALDWNQPAWRFYEAIGAQLEPDWRVFKLEGPALARLAAGP